MKEYVNYPFRFGKFDFMFVDGRERIKCLGAVRQKLNKNGKVILHDTFRKKYKEGTNLFKIEKEERNTMLLSQSKYRK